MMIVGIVTLSDFGCYCIYSTVQVHFCMREAFNNVLPTMFPSPPPLLPFSLSAGCEVGLVLGALSGSGQTEHRAHVALTLDKLLEALQGDSSSQGRMLQEVLAQIFILVYISITAVLLCRVRFDT